MPGSESKWQGKRDKTKNINLPKVVVLSGFALTLLLFLWFGFNYSSSKLNQEGGTATRAYVLTALRELQCCRWNRYVVNGGGGQTGLAVNPRSTNIVYATTDNAGIVKSTNYGDTWQSFNNNIGSMRLADVKLDPLNPDILYVTALSCRGCGGGELYRSLDGGAHWEFITSAFGVETWPSTRAIVIVPQDADGDQISDVIYLGAWAGNKGGKRGGIWKSSNEGATWSQIGAIDGDSELMKWADAWVLRNDPSNSDILYAGMYTDDDTVRPRGIWKSADGGLHWIDITHNIPVSNISDIAISPDGSVLYAATNAFDQSKPGAGIYKSINSGQSWAPINHGLERTSLKFQFLLMDKDNSNVLYAGAFRSPVEGIFKTTDGGQHWHHMTFDNSGWWAEYFDNAWAITEGADSTLYVATWKGIYRSKDDGETWHAFPYGLGNIMVYDIALDPQNPSTVYLGLADIGPWKSADGGHTWTRIQQGFFEPYSKQSGSAAAFAVSLGNPNIIYSAVLGSSGVSPFAGVNKTTDGGQTWKAVNNGLPRLDLAQVTQVAVHPRTPDIAYVGICRDDGAGQVFKTINGGNSWAELTKVDPKGRLTSVESLAISASNPETVLMGTRAPARVYKTDDGGKSWSIISPPPDLMDPETIIYAIDIHPLDPQQIIIGVNVVGAYKTTDGGQTWTHILDASFFRKNVGDLALNPEVPIEATIEALKFDPDDPQIIYAGHNNRGRGGFGIVKSTDGGASWTFINDPGLQYRNIYDLEIHPQTKTLFVGGFDGVYVYEQY